MLTSCSTIVLNEVAMLLQARILFSHPWCLEYVQRQKKEVLGVLLVVEVAAKVFVFCRWRSAVLLLLLCSVTPAQLLLLFLTKVSLLPGLDWRRRRLSSEAEKSTFRKLWAYPACCCIAFWRVLIHIPAFDPHTCFRFSYCNFLFSSQVSILQVFILFFKSYNFFVDFAFLGFSVTCAHNPQNDSCVMKGLRPLRSYAISGSNQVKRVKRVKLIMLAFSFYGIVYQTYIAILRQFFEDFKGKEDLL